MKQILQYLNNGATKLVEVPCPGPLPAHLLIRGSVSLISAGTERMLIEFGRAGLLDKARSQPERVRQALDKIRTDGLLPTVEAVQNKLSQPLPLGYSHVGRVLDVGTSALPFSIGERVVGNGPHAEIVAVPSNLCAVIPDNVSDEEAAFTVVGAIGLEGVRLAQPTLGESFVVIGLGLIGLLTVQLLRANGCRVLGIDLNSDKCALAQQFGAQIADMSTGEDPLAATQAFSENHGVDGVLITAATKSSEPVHQAAEMCRKRGRIVLVGVTGLELQRSDFYAKELSFQVSCSYGPGRYDAEYEERGHDYPLGYVRWTEQRNFEAVLNLMAMGKLKVKPLITHRFPFEKAEDAYQIIADGKEAYIGMLLEYPPEIDKADEQTDFAVRLIELPDASAQMSPQTPVIGMIGAGNYSAQVLLPALRPTGARLKVIASNRGLSGTHLGTKFGFEKSTTDVASILVDSEITTVLITTRHDTHARFVINALKAGKHVFVEKPLCLTSKELQEIVRVYKAEHASDNARLLMVGFNRRFAPHVIKMKELLASVHEPKSMIMTVNAGAIPVEHWTRQPAVGGGRILGEACHFIDLLRFLSAQAIVKYEIFSLPRGNRDTVTIQLAFADGSLGTIHYFANGHKRVPKERLEVFCEGKILRLDNFKTMRGYGWHGFSRLNLWRQDKGHAQEMTRFTEAIRTGAAAPIPCDEIFEVTRVTLALAQQL